MGNSHRDSFSSQGANSSTIHMIPLEPPHAPFAQERPPSSNSRERDDNFLLPPNQNLNRLSRDSSNISLTVNYIPQKFPSTILAPSNPRRRRPTGKVPHTPEGVNPFAKRGGGVDAFNRSEARIADHADEDYDGVQEFGALGLGRVSSPMTPGKVKVRKMKWNKFKVVLFITNTLLALSSLSTLILLLLTYFSLLPRSPILLTGNVAELSLSTLFACTGLLTSLIGYTGILLNNRSFLAVYTFLTWITFAFLVIPGYVAYHRRTFNLEGKVNAEWSRDLGTDGRRVIQDQLGCCGYFSPFIEATVTQTCYARSVLPGCKLAYLKFQRSTLQRFYIASFTLVPIQLAVVIAGLLCSNHVTYRFGKGMMPKAYRLEEDSVKVIVERYLEGLKELYGENVVEDIRRRSTMAPMAGNEGDGTSSDTFGERAMDTVGSGNSLGPLLKRN
ncbi:hypothetical protein VKT23_013362 [Stygiomarasmius scandens]|uniref:Tetraspanin Tsp2 n=1 Tax=Marasmiellus scandens TaxID=2682957 RepID=A0ABR1J4G8_9AGAR